MVTIDAVIEDRTVAGMKIDVEGFEIEVLRGCERALSDKRIGLIQLEWNEMSRETADADRRSVASLLSKHGYMLYRPDGRGTLMPLPDPGFGPDVFARPATLCNEYNHRVTRISAAAGAHRGLPGSRDRLL